MEDIGVIRKVTHPTPWVNAIVIVAKKDKSIRVCLDPRPLNKVIRRSHYALPTLTDIAAKLHGATVFSKLDARSGYWMCEIDDESADLCTFGTPFGRYQFLRLPYGISCAGEVFHAKIRQALENLDGVDSFIDDIIVWGSNRDEHDKRLKLLLDRAREVGIRFNRDKCEFCVSQVGYLGHIFDANGMHIDKNKLNAIINMPSPNDKPSLERFLGMVNYLSKFIPNHSNIVLPLRDLLKKNSEWYWDSVMEQVVETLKQALCRAPVLALYAARRPALLSVDASARAAGAVLLQDGRPVEFASVTFTDTQQRYAQIEKELLAIVFALERFHQYVYGKTDVIVETDHKPLEALFKKSLNSVPARLQRMMLRIQCYEFTVVYKPGKYMYVADTLSRAPLPDVMSDKVSHEVDEQTCFLLENVRFSDVKMQQIKNAARNDEEYKLLSAYIQSGWPRNKYDVHETVKIYWAYRSSLEFADGIIFKDNLVVIPRSLRTDMLSRVHDGHAGIDRCKRHARDVMFWPGMSRDIELVVRRCATCSMHAATPRREPLMPHAIPELPWIKIGSDILQFRDKYYVILIDYFSNYVEVNPLNNITSKAVILAMKDQFARHGIPKELISDNGPAYSSREFAKFSEDWGFRHVTTSPNYPQSNGRSERTVRTIKNMLIKSLESGTDFYLGLLNFRATPRDGIAAPCELMMGRRINTRLPIHHDKLRPSRDNYTDYNNIMKKQIISKMNHDMKCKRTLSELNPGDDVVVINGDRRGKARVLSRASAPRSYFVSDSTGRTYRRNRRHLIARSVPDSDTIQSKDSGQLVDVNSKDECKPSTSAADPPPRRQAAEKARSMLSRFFTDNVD